MKEEKKTLMQRFRENNALMIESGKKLTEKSPFHQMADDQMVPLTVEDVSKEELVDVIAGHLRRARDLLEELRK